MGLSFCVPERPEAGTVLTVTLPVGGATAAGTPPYCPLYCAVFSIAKVSTVGCPVALTGFTV